MMIQYHCISPAEAAAAKAKHELYMKFNKPSPTGSHQRDGRERRGEAKIREGTKDKYKQCHIMDKTL